MDAEKLEFLRVRFAHLLKKLPSDTPPQWGRMTVQQMIEHFSGAVRVASGSTSYPEIVSAPDHLEKLRQFLQSDKPFRENTKHPLLPEDPLPVRNASLEEAIRELQAEIENFVSVFEKQPSLLTRNPIFGDLNFEENMQLLYKHALHHLKQFGITLNETTA
ncbi:MAG TPA: hypothetical protein VHK91_13145 [Flavisolibacter sp.]|jgi:hypothetical protein|nr:hypothetical protein [Flavisolibacter sp.]